MKVFVSVLILGLAQAFTAPRSKSRSPIILDMAPKFDGTKWVTNDPSEGPEAGYAPIKTLLMHGPKPWFERTFKPDEYEQAVLKFMAGDKCGREEAQGNMDFYLRNPNDWQFMRMEMERTGKKVDYSKLEVKAVVLVAVWSGIVAFFVSNAFIAVTTGQSFWAFLGK